MTRNDRANLLKQCELIELPAGKVLSAPGIPHIYFPISGYISVATMGQHGNGLEVSMIGNEGLYGLPSSLGVEINSSRATVQSSGQAWSIEANRFSQELKKNKSLQASLHRYVVILIEQLYISSLQFASGFIPSMSVLPSGS